VLWLHPLSKIPGPKIWVLSRIPYFRRITGGTWIHAVHALHERYGPIVRIGANEVSFIDPRAWQDIYGHHGGDKNFPRNPVWYQPSLNGAHHILSAPDADHARIRRLLSHAFSDRALKSQEPLIQVYFDLLMDRLRDMTDGRTINIGDWFQFTTFDITGDLEFGESFGCLRNGEYHPWIKLLLSNFRKIIVFGASQLIPGLSLFVTFMIPKKTWVQRRQHFNYTVDKVGRRLQRGDDPTRPDFVSHITRYNDEKGMTRAEIDSTFNVLVIAGSETTSTCLTATVHSLLRNPDKYEKLKKEIRETFHSDSQITTETTEKLPYLTAVIEESLRLCPPAPTMLPRCVPKDGAMVCGYWLPGGVCFT
jgi:cytochrome P450